MLQSIPQDKVAQVVGWKFYAKNRNRDPTQTIELSMWRPTTIKADLYTLVGYTEIMEDFTEDKEWNYTLNESEVFEVRSYSMILL